jgi:hypothetical protein
MVTALLVLVMVPVVAPVRLQAPMVTALLVPVMVNVPVVTAVLIQRPMVMVTVPALLVMVTVVMVTMTLVVTVTLHLQLASHIGGTLDQGASVPAVRRSSPQVQFRSRPTIPGRLCPT